MKFALVDNKRRKATKNAHMEHECLCPVCDHLVYARHDWTLGYQWRHTVKGGCDERRETETGWHRDWKECFPGYSQEIECGKDSTGKRRMFDIRTRKGVALKLLHTPIDPDDMTKRTAYYQQSAARLHPTGKFRWIVDCEGERREAFTRMLNNHCSSTGLRDIDGRRRIQIIPSSAFCDAMSAVPPLDVPVVFDLHERGVWIVLGHVDKFPGRGDGGHALVIFTSRDALVADIKAGGELQNVDDLVDLADSYREMDAQRKWCLETGRDWREYEAGREAMA